MLTFWLRFSVRENPFLSYSPSTETLQGNRLQHHQDVLSCQVHG